MFTVEVAKPKNLAGGVISSAKRIPWLDPSGRLARNRQGIEVSGLRALG
jgi:hypothetical protein